MDEILKHPIPYKDSPASGQLTEIGEDVPRQKLFFYH